MVNPRLVNLAEKLGSDVLPKEETTTLPPSPPQDLKDPDTKCLENSIKLENIVCTDANGNKIEYPVVYVPKDVIRDGNGGHVSDTPYDWIVYFEQKGLFLPDYSLTCNLLAELFKNKNRKDFNHVLMQYKDYGSGWGWHAQNTIVNWGAKKIIHYPTKEDLPGDALLADINVGRKRREYSFNPEEFGDLPLKKALRISHFERYIRNLTGLRDPQILVELGEHFGKIAKIWVPNNPSQADYTSAVWLGCSSSSFSLYTSSSLINNSAARGVRAEKMRSL